ncbi:MAG: uL15 family ribosomal protein, partial [Actinomycetes bacterium]
YQVVNLDKIVERFPDGGTIGVDELVAKGLVRDNNLVKVLGDGDISVKLDVTAHKFSATAKDKIAAAGGSTTEL